MKRYEYNLFFKLKGSVMLELAILLPLLLLIVAGIVQFGFILNAKVAVNSASYEGARAATLSDDPETAAVDAVKNYAGSSLPGWNLGERLKVKVNVPDNNPGTQVSVEVLYSIPLYFKNIPAFFGHDNSILDIRGVSIMRVEEKE